MEKCNFLFYTHFSSVSITKLYFTCILFIGKFVPTSMKIENLLCQNIFIALLYNSLHFHTIFHSGKFMWKPSFRLNIEWCIFSYCPLKPIFLCHNSFSSSHHQLTPFPWGTWSSEYGWVAEKWVTLTYSTDVWVKKFRTKLLILLIFYYFFPQQIQRKHSFSFWYLVTTDVIGKISEFPWFGELTCYQLWVKIHQKKNICTIHYMRHASKCLPLIDQTEYI